MKKRVLLEKKTFEELSRGDIIVKSFCNEYVYYTGYTCLHHHRYVLMRRIDSGVRTRVYAGDAQKEYDVLVVDF